MAVVTDLGSRLYEDCQLGVRGGLYQDSYLVDGQVASRWYGQLLISATFTESVVEAARQAVFVLDNSMPDLLAPISVGAEMQFFGLTVDPETGLPANLEGERLFSGLCFDDGRLDSAGAPTRTFTAYDICTLLARDEDTVVFPAGSTMTSILQQIAAITGLNLGEVVETEVDVGQIVMGAGTASTWWAVLTEAAARTFDKSGRRFFVRARQGTQNFVPGIDLLEMGSTGQSWRIADGAQGVLEEFFFNESAENVRTAVTVVGEDPNDTERVLVMGTAEDGGDFLRTFGRLRTLIAPDFSELDQAGVDKRVGEELTNRARTIKRATTTGLLIPSVRRGDSVQLVSRTGVSSRWYVETVVSSYRAGRLQQSLELVMDLRDVG